MPLASTISLPDRYRVVRRIASGGMASVWEADDLLLGRVVAVKVLAAHYAADPEARARFQREARTAAQVSDQTNVVTIYDIGEHDDDAFIVMEHFAGGTVADRLRAAREARERVPRDVALRWLREAAAGLDVAHAAGIVHRDVKPANLLLDAHDRLAVADFGIARLADDTPMTQTGQVLGTAAYISPEQALGETATAASDRYALAVVAYELLTGSRPFAGGPPGAQARQHAEAQPSPASLAAPGLPKALDAVLARGLAKDPGDRPATATALVAEIASALDAEPVEEPTKPFAALAPVRRTTPLIPSPPPPATMPAPNRQGRQADARPHRPAASAAPRGGRRATTEHEPPRTRPAPRPALLAAALLAAAIVALVLALTRGASEPRREAGARSQTTAARASGSSRTATATAAASAPKPPPPPQAATGASPSALNDRGYALLQQGRYVEAVDPLRAAVQGYRAAGVGGLPYAYALFNLAVALNRSGNPTEAVPLLRERLKFGDQRKTVQAELDAALAKLGGPAAGLGKQKGKKDKRDRG